MYFLDEIERKRLVRDLLPLARKTGISEELRGWSWHEAPMKPYYEDEKIPMYLVCSRYCPSNRDVFLNKVEGVQPTINFKVSQGITMHETVSQLLTMFIEESLVNFEDWWEKKKGNINYSGKDEDGVEKLHRRAKRVWSHTLHNCNAQYSNACSKQPYACDRDVMSTSVPFLVEHKIDGSLLGLSGLLGIDCYDYLRSIVFDLKTISSFDDREKWHRLYPTGYALVLESVYEVPVEVGCIVWVSFKDDRLVVEKELFFINDDLRSWWLEERDKKLDIVAQKKDPGMPNKCPEDCIYREECDR